MYFYDYGYYFFIFNIIIEVVTDSKIWQIHRTHLPLQLINSLYQNMQ